MELEVKDAGKALAEQLPSLTRMRRQLRRTAVCFVTMRLARMPAQPISIFPRFIKKIATGNLRGSAATIFCLESSWRHLRAGMSSAGIVRGSVRAGL